MAILAFTFAVPFVRATGDVFRRRVHRLARGLNGAISRRHGGALIRRAVSCWWHVERLRGMVVRHSPNEHSTSCTTRWDWRCNWADSAIVPGGAPCSAVSLIVDIMSIAVATFAAPLVRSTGDLVRREFARIERGWAAVMSRSLMGASPSAVHLLALAYCRRSPVLSDQDIFDTAPVATRCVDRKDLLGNAN
jgi:hypothetical protein